MTAYSRRFLRDSPRKVKYPDEPLDPPDEDPVDKSVDDVEKEED